MTAAAEPVPTLELPSAALMQWSQLALLLAAQLAARRERLDRLAWATDEHAARAHDLAELREAIEPAVRAMTTDEIAHWPTSNSDHTPEADSVSAEVAPINDRWALHATARHDDTTVGHVWVSCRDETLARELAREIVACGQPETVYRLGAHVALAEQADAYRAQVQASAPATDRHAMAAHVQSAWPHEVAAVVLGCPAWPTLADKLAAVQHHGQDLPALLGRLNTSGIPTARKPAALAAWLLDQATLRPPRQQGLPREQPNAAAHPDREELLSWIDGLDPASSIDRVGALGVLGQYGAGVDARLLSHFPDLLDDAPDRATRATQVAAETLAGDWERSAAAHQATVDDPTTTRREDLDGQELAHRDRHEAAAARALAAENQAAPHAAVARANVILTPPTSQSTARTATPPPPVVQPSAPMRTPRRTR
ncbi:MAG TPA: hypothetical protein VF003_17460 [Pseudonocardiaceae bacterium]